jgi:hypothetical protein
MLRIPLESLGDYPEKTGVEYYTLLRDSALSQ